jgi:hypothetical protein
MINLLPEELRSGDVPAKKMPEDIKLRRPNGGNGTRPIASVPKVEKSIPKVALAPVVVPIEKTEKPVKQEVVGNSSGRIKKSFFGLFGRKIKLTMDLLKIENEEAYRQNFFETLSQAGRIIFVLSVFYALMFFGAKFYNLNVAEQTREISGQLSAVRSEIVQYESSESDLVKIGKRYAAISALLDKHIYWDKFFGNLESCTLPGVSYGEIVASDDGKIALSATAENYSQLAFQLKAFQIAKDFIKKVEINSGSLTGAKPGEVSFQVNLELADKFLVE